MRSALIQPHFDYACPAWSPNLTRKTKKKIQIMQNKCTRDCNGTRTQNQLDK